MKSAQQPAASWPQPPRNRNRNRTSTTLASKKLKCIVLGGASAGKTSILRRYFHGNFDPNRMPTLGSDFYSRKIPNPLEDDEVEEQIEESKSIPTHGAADDDGEEKKEATPSSSSNSTAKSSSSPKSLLSMQVWDTPGKERFAANRKPMYTAAFSDNFFKNADAALLVYDMTSSTSFTHVLKWHADLMERIRRLESTGERTRPFPVLVVANKMDIVKDRDTCPIRKLEAVVHQRDIMGLSGKTFRGKDSRYEYSATSSPPHAPSSSSRPTTNSSTSLTSNTSSNIQQPSPRSRFEISTYMGTGEKTSYLETVLNNDEIMKGGYLESLLSTEDTSHPDKDMVLLWCMRNGLSHMEVSALDGTGIDELMKAVVQVSLESNQHTLSPPPPRPPTNNNDTQTIFLAERNDALDLHRRYAPKNPWWKAWPFQGCCKA